MGLPYSLENRQNVQGVPDLTEDRVRNGLQKAIEKAAASQASGKKIKTKAGGDLRKSLATFISEVPPVLVDHTLQANGFDVTKTPTEILESKSLFEDLLKSLGEARQTVENITSSGTCKGYIFAKYRNTPAPDATEEAQRENLLYEDFHPFCPKKLADDPEIKVLEFDGYNQTVDEFFSSLEGQKLESKVSEREATAQKRIEAAKQEQTRRIEGLQEVQATNFRKAAAIEANVQRVQEAMDAVNGLLAQGMDWVDVSKLVEREKKKHNPVAEIIKTPLKLEEGLITLTLAEEDFEQEAEEDPFETDSESEDEEELSKTKPDMKGLQVDINLSLSPWSNAREYYEERRTAAGKQEKTQAQSAKALKNTEKKINEDLKKGLKQEKALLQPIRKQMWFEKFIWFISSDGYLVLGGKDATQNEMLYKRYLRKGDVYCHADMHGASSVIIKNNPKTPDAPVPPQTLTQAGTLSVCTSSAWDSKAGMGAWWVNADQVSKSAPTGEFLPQGSFMIRGSKNFLPAAQLLMGLGFMFRISEESKARHVKHRLHDDDSEPEREVISAGDLKPEPSNGDDRYGEEDDDDSMPDDHSDKESADERDEKRDNPLQFNGNAEKVEEQDVEEAEQGVSNIQLDDAREDENAPENGSEDSDRDDQDHEETPSEAPSKTSTAQSTATSTRNGPPKRGKKGKAKKIAAKYKNQDEEDRLAAEALIGATTGKQKAEAEAKAKAEKEAEAAFQKERRRQQHEKRQKETKEHEEIRKVMMEEGVEMLDDEEESKSTSLDDLVGTPLAGDEIVEVIPVCAPWMALGRFKYKAKLQPGAVKKGKAVKEVLERFKADSTRKGTIDPQGRDPDKMWPREVELIKGLKPEEIVNSVPVGKVRVMLTGGGGGGGKGKGGAKGKGKKK